MAPTVPSRLGVREKRNGYGILPITVSLHFKPHLKPLLMERDRTVALHKSRVNCYKSITIMVANMNSENQINQQAMLWKVSYGDIVMFFEDEELAKHNFEAFKRAELNPSVQEFRLASTISA